MELVILVDEEDNEIGVMEKMEAHKKGLLHRAFSVFLFDSKGRMLIQKRAQSKYHSGGLWTNACCSHPRSNESVEEAARRRLIEELGIEADVSIAFCFTYQAKLDNDLQEHEFDHVLLGTYEGDVNYNDEEVEDFLFIEIDKLLEDIEKDPDNFTIWFKIALPKVVSFMSESQHNLSF